MGAYAALVPLPRGSEYTYISYIYVHIRTGHKGAYGCAAAYQGAGPSTGVYAKMRLCRSAHKSYECGVHVGGAYTPIVYKTINGGTYTRGPYQQGYAHTEVHMRPWRAPGLGPPALAVKEEGHHK